MKKTVLFCIAAIALSACGGGGTDENGDPITGFVITAEPITDTPTPVTTPEPTPTPVAPTVVVTPTVSEPTPVVDVSDPDITIVIDSPVIVVDGPVTVDTPNPTPVPVEMPTVFNFNTLMASTVSVQEVQSTCQGRYNEFNSFFVNRDSDVVETSFETSFQTTTPDGIISYWTSADFGQPSPGVAIEANVGGAIFTVFAGNCNVQVLQGFTVPDPDGFTEIFNNANPTQACLSEFPAGAEIVGRFPLYTIAGNDYGNFAVDYTLTEGNTTTTYRQVYETRYNGVNFNLFCPAAEVRNVETVEVTSRARC